MSIQRIAIFSGKRGGLGAYLPLIRLIETDPGLSAHLILGDMHASAFFGSTAEEARALFPRTDIRTIDMGTSGDDSAGARIRGLGTLLRDSAAVLDAARPDILFVHGDRAEHLLMAQSAATHGILVAHTQGGDVSGNIDEQQRHAISKLAHLHFPETRDAAARLALLGEDPWRIHPVGSLYVDRIVARLFPPAQSIRERYGLGTDGPYVIVLVHPETWASSAENGALADAVLTAVEGSGLRALAVYPCSDPGFAGIVDALERRRGSSGVSLWKNVPNMDFLGLLSGAAALVGNSSAALVEAPYLGVPAVNVGGRQRNRARDLNVVDVAAPTAASVAEALRHVMDDQAFRAGCARAGGMLGDGTASRRILAIVRGLTPGDARYLQKSLTYADADIRTGGIAKGNGPVL